MLPAPLKRFFTPPGHRFALLVVLGMTLVAAPAVEVWRRHGLALQFAVESRRGLEAVTLAVHAQRALVSHRPYAAAVLAGRNEQEGERLRRQQAVDAEVAALAAALEVRRLYRALEEADHLRDDWSTLLQGLGRRQMTAAASDAAHDLLIEQTFVIVDLVAGASGLFGAAGRAFDAEELMLALHALPRFAAALDTQIGTRIDAEVPGMSPPSAHGLRTSAHRMSNAARAALAAADAAGAAGAPPHPSLVRALVALQQRAALLAQTPSPAAAMLQRARSASLEATEALVARLDTGLVHSISVLHLERRAVAAAGALALLIVMLAAARVLPRPRRSRAQASATMAALASRADPAALDASAGSNGAESEGPTSDLLQRLRQRELHADASSADHRPRA